MALCAGGSVQKSNERKRILVQLIDATTGRHIWSERYDRNLKDLFALQGEIDPLFAHVILAAACIEIGQEDEARSHAKEVLKINPNFSLDRFQIFHFQKDPAILDRPLAALRKAGLK